MENTNLSDLNNQTLAQLRQTAKELNIKSVTKYKKAELIEQIKEHANKLKSNDIVIDRVADNINNNFQLASLALANMSNDNEIHFKMYGICKSMYR